MTSLPRLHLDMETFAQPRKVVLSDGRRVDGVDLAKDGVWNYARHPASGCYMFGVKIASEPAFVAILWKIVQGATGRAIRLKTEAELFAEYPRLPRFLHAMAAGAVTVAHNAAFERHCWNNMICRPGWFPGWPKIHVEQQDCTMARANAMSLPGGLESLANVLRLKNRKFDSTLMKLMAASDPSNAILVTEQTLAEEAVYCAQDVEVEAEADGLLYPLNPLQRRLWLLDQDINDRGIPVNEIAIRKALVIAEAAKELANARISHLTGGKVKTGQQSCALAAWLREQGHKQIDSVAAYTLKRYGEDSGWGSETIEEVLEMRACTAKSSVAKLPAILDQLRISINARVRHQYVFMGAGTGRWTGRGFQPQNLVRFDDDTQPMADAMLEVLNNPLYDGLIDATAKPAERRSLAAMAVNEIVDRTRKNPLIVIGKCMRVFIRAPQ